MRNPASESFRSLCGALTRSNPLTISTQPFSSGTRQAASVSLGKLSPPSLTAVTR